MPAASAQTRFLIRGSILIVVLLLIWWLVLVNPLLSLLRASGEFFGSLVFGGSSRELITETDSGDWTFNIAVELIVSDLPDKPGPVKLHSIIFDIPRSDVVAFTFSLPVFWAIILAIPGVRRSVRPLIVGTAVVAFLEIVLLLVFVEISTTKVVARLTHSQGEFAKWLARFGEYLVVLVIPYVAPVLIALSIHPQTRESIFGNFGQLKRGERAEKRLDAGRSW